MSFRLDREQLELRGTPAMHGPVRYEALARNAQVSTTGRSYCWGAPMPESNRDIDPEAPRYLLVPEPACLGMSPVERRRFRRVPGFSIERGSNQGYIVLLRRNDQADE